MKPPPSSLHPLLLVLRREEQAALQGYARTLLARQMALEKLEKSGRHLAETCDRFERQLLGQSTAAQLTRLRLRCRVLHQRRLRLERAVAQAQQRLQLAYMRLLAARRAVTMVDKFYHLQQARLHRPGKTSRRRSRQNQPLRDEPRLLEEALPGAIPSWN